MTGSALRETLARAAASTATVPAELEAALLDPFFAAAGNAQQALPFATHRPAWHGSIRRGDPRVFQRVGLNAAELQTRIWNTNPR
jgi:hypothetical protein